MSAAGARLGRSFYARGAEVVARDLLGQRFVRVLDDGMRLAGIVVETEAYMGVEDRAAHSFGGRRTTRNESMYARAGTLYVYFTYGMHHCMNVVCGRVGEPVAVLIRALEPTEGLERMSIHRRGGVGKGGREAPTAELCAGPGRLCRALAVDRTLDGEDMIEGDRCFIERARKGRLAEEHLLTTPRIGIGSAGAWTDRPLRWVLRGSRFASRRDRG